MKERDRCISINEISKRCILDAQHFGAHEDTTGIRWGDAPQCPVFLPNGKRCLRKYGHELPHKMFTGVDFVEFTDDDIARNQEQLVKSTDYEDEWQKLNKETAIIPLPPQSLARRLFNILDHADDRPFIPISQDLIKEVLIALPKQYL